MRNALFAAVVVLGLGPTVGCALGFTPNEWGDAPDSGAKKLDAGKPDTGANAQDSGPAEEDTWQPEQPDTGPQCSLGISYGTQQCDTCMSNSCCQADNACVNDAQCTGLIGCLNNCSDQQCYTTCTNQYPSGATLLDAIGSCMQSSCANDCR